MDKGPWTVSENDDRINSDDFTHDASLILYGDFAPENRRSYLEFIAKELNDCATLRARVAQLEEELRIAQFDNNVVIPELQGMVKQLEEAVEWALTQGHILERPWFITELRRRTGRE